jgi:TonB family protein
MRFKIRHLLGLCLFVLAHASVFSQVPNDNPKNEWVRLDSDNGEFSVEMPANPTYFYDRDGFYYPLSYGSDIQYGEVRLLNAADDKTVMSVEIYRLNAPKKGLDILLEKQRTKAEKLENLPDGFTGKESEISVVKGFGDRKDAAVSCVSRFIASKTHLYIVTVANRGARTPAFDRFLSSIRVGGNQTGNTKISTLKALALDDVGTDATKTPKPSVPSPKPGALEKKEPNPTPLLILNKPFASYTDAARRSLTSGKIVLRVTFEKDGRISKIAVLSGLPNGLNRSAFFAALRIKFIPEEKDGVPTTVSKPVEYTFSVG